MTDREAIARIIAEHVSAQLQTAPIVNGRIKADLKVLPIADAILAAQQDGAWQPIDTAPSACHVLATRFDDCEWSSQVVLSPPSHPFTHWRPLPDPPRLEQGVDT